jgi:hypothetical protein
LVPEAVAATSLVAESSLAAESRLEASPLAKIPPPFSFAASRLDAGPYPAIAVPYAPPYAGAAVIWRRISIAISIRVVAVGVIIG